MKQKTSEDLIVAKQNMLPKNYTGYVYVTSLMAWCWYKNGLLHREDGPAIDDDNGEEIWYENGSIHRLDGPAVKSESVYGQKRENYYIDGVCLSKQEHEQNIRVRTFMVFKLIDLLEET